MLPHPVAYIALAVDLTYHVGISSVPMRAPSSEDDKPSLLAG